MNDRAKLGEGLVMRALRNIRAGEAVYVGSDVEQLPHGHVVIDVPHPDVDIQIAIPEGTTAEEAQQIGEQLFGGRGVTVGLEIPENVKTVGDFFGEKMARSIAEQAWDRMHTTCPTCREETAFPHQH